MMRAFAGEEDALVRGGMALGWSSAVVASLLCRRSPLMVAVRARELGVCRLTAAGKAEIDALPTAARNERWRSLHEAALQALVECRVEVPEWLAQRAGYWNPRTRAVTAKRWRPAGMRGHG